MLSVRVGLIGEEMTVFVDLFVTEGFAASERSWLVSKQPHGPFGIIMLVSDGVVPCSMTMREVTVSISLILIAERVHTIAEFWLFSGWY